MGRIARHKKTGITAWYSGGPFCQQRTDMAIAWVIKKSNKYLNVWSRQCKDTGEWVDALWGYGNDGLYRTKRQTMYNEAESEHLIKETCQEIGRTE